MTSVDLNMKAQVESLVCSLESASRQARSYSISVESVTTRNRYAMELGQTPEPYDVPSLVELNKALSKIKHILAALDAIEGDAISLENRKSMMSGTQNQVQLSRSRDYE